MDVASRLHELATTTGADDNPRRVIDRFARAAEAYDASGRLEQAIECWDGAIATARTSDADASELHERRARVLSELDPARARRAWQEIVRVATDRRDLDAQARALVQASVVAHDRDDERALLGEAAALGCAWSHRASARAAIGAGHVSRAIDFDEAALEGARRAGDLLLEAAASAGLGTARSQLGHVDQALELLEHAARIAAAQHDHRLAIAARLNMVDLLVEQLEIDVASRECVALRRYVERHGRSGWLPGVLAQDVTIRIEAGELGKAREVAELATALVGDDHGADVVALVALSRAHAKNEQEIDDDQVASAIGDARTAVEAGRLASFEFEVEVLEREQRHRAGAFEIGDGDDPADGAEELVTRARHALWLARRASRMDDAELRDVASAWTSHVDALVNDVPVASPFARLALDESRLHLSVPDARVARELDVVASRWERRGCRLQAARARLGALVARIRSGQLRGPRMVVAAESVRNEFVACGAWRDLDDVRQLLIDVDASTDATNVANGELFVGLDATAARELEAAMSIQSLAAGHELRIELDDADRVSMVCSGRVLVRGADGDGADLVDEGCVFGQEALFGGALGAKPSVVRALEPSVVASIPAARLRELVTRHPSLAVSLLGIAGRRVACVTERHARLAGWSVPQRLAALLLEHGDRYGRAALDGGTVIQRRTGQADIALLIGASRELVSRTMAAWREQGVLRSRGRTVVIADRSTLAEIASGTVRSAVS